MNIEIIQIQKEDARELAPLVADFRVALKSYKGIQAHPNNHRMISFLWKYGYTVLNLIEVRKPYPGEKLTQEIQVGDHPIISTLQEVERK